MHRYLAGVKRKLEYIYIFPLHIMIPSKIQRELSLFLADFVVSPLIFLEVTSSSSSIPDYYYSFFIYSIASPSNSFQTGLFPRSRLIEILMYNPLIQNRRINIFFFSWHRSIPLFFVRTPLRKRDSE